MQSVVEGGVRLEPPTPRRPSVVRSRLLARLRDRFHRPITVVVAPAGFGKTTLLAQAVGENRLASQGVDHWLTCRADDDVGSSLAEGMCRAMGIVPPRGDRALDAVVEAMWHRSPGEVALVLDDVHEIPSGSPGAEVLAGLVARLPRNGHLVLVGRRAPPVPLSRLDVEGAVLRLDEADLLFTEDELDEFALSRRVSAEQLADCGGWPALAELAANAVPGVDADYLWEEVLAQLKPDRQRALALLAHVGAVDDGLASATLGTTVDVAELTADLPLVTTTSDGGRQIHGLWRQHLAKSVDEADIAAARRRAGSELARRGDVAAGVRLLSEAAAWDDITTVVIDVLAAANPPVPGDLVAAWLGRLPEDMSGSALARLLAAARAVQTDPAAATRELEEAATAFRQEGNAAGELACIAQLAQVAWWSEQPERLMLLATRLFEMEAVGHEPAVPLACMARALIADVVMDSVTVLHELDRIPTGWLTPPSQSMVDWLRATSLTHLGRQAEALEAAKRACANAGPLHAPVIESSRIQALWFLGHVDEVVRELPPLVERTAATGLRDYTALMAAACCITQAVLGRADEAAPYLELARSAAASPDFPLVAANLAIADATLAVARGDEAQAAAILEEYLERWPSLGRGLAGFPQQRTLTVWYVLVPSSRPMWDAASLGPTFVTARQLAQAVVAVRARGRLPAASPDLPSPGVTRALLPLPWATELALAHIAAGGQAGWTLLEALWPGAQADVRRCAASGPGVPASLARPARNALGRLPVPPAGHLELKLLGPVELRRDGTAIEAPEWRRERVRSLLAHLVLHRPVSRERLATDLWPNLDAPSQSRNLRVTLTHLLRVLEPERAERDASFLVRPHGAGLMLQGGEWFTADVWRFDELWQQATEADARGLPSTALSAMQEAVALWREDPSELALEGWALAEVEERRMRLVGLAARAAELLLARDEPDQARRIGEVALRTDPWSERAHRVVVAACVAARDHRAALQALDRYRAALDELGIDPGASASSFPPR